ncbi:MAG: 3-oxoacyl-[acyl-carrier protein] reductase [Thermoanaerobacteraceae bacterium]|nr:3-oxoacyl-[acyl-carrier protein] reductase [Thermoanaerobacteraceae bacterium]
MLFEDKVSIVTGGASGIGKACALSLAENGAKVAVVDLNEKGAEETTSKILEKGSQAISIKIDISKSEDVDKAVDTVLKSFGKIDILVNCAGICQIRNFDDLTENEWDKMLSINLKGTFLMCQRVLKEMKKNRYGKIVNLGSLAGEVGGIYVGANYAASKAGVICLTKSIAKNAAPYNINVNSVSPGFINTEMTKDFGYDPKTVPLGRIGTPEEVADVILFLCSDASRYITGANIDVNGGVFMG